MQVQDYLPFFQDLLLQYYQFTLENSVYAVCLAVAVWLLTSVFYSLRIGFLNRRNRINLKVGLDAQNGLVASQQEIQRLQEEIAACNNQIEQEARRTEALDERIAGLAGQLSASIVALAAEPELGQQGLSVTKDLEAEHLWQRYSAAVKHLGETLIAERKNIGELRLAHDAETAKLAEKDGQLQAMQTRLDSQRQQLAKLELALEEQKSQSDEQQELAQGRLSEVEAKYQADLARLAALEKQAQEWNQAKSQQIKPKASDAAIAEPKQVKPAELRAEPAQTVAVEPEPQYVKVEAKPAVSEAVTHESTIARAETAKQQPKADKIGEEASGGVSGKFKSLFSSAKQQMEKLDDMFGLSTPMLEPKESGQTDRPSRMPQTAVIETPISQPSVPIPEQQAEIAVKEPAAGLTGKFKNLFASSKEKAIETVTVEEKSAELVPVESQPQPTHAVDANEVNAVTERGKLKNLFSVFIQRRLKRKA
jgi:hypothetical protein